MIESRLSTVLGARRRSVAEVARSAGISRMTVWRLYHDKTEKVDLGVVDRLCRELRCGVGELLVYVPDGDVAAPVGG